MKQFLTLSLLAAMFLLTGCPYQSEEPVDQGSYPIPSWITGKWQQVKSDGSGTIFEVSTDKPNASEAAVSSQSEANRKMRLSLVGKTVFMSVYEPGDDLTEAGWYIYRMTKKSNTEIELLPLKEHTDISSAGSLKDFLRQHENDETVFEKPEQVTYKKL